MFLLVIDILLKIINLIYLIKNKYIYIIFKNDIKNYNKIYI